MIQEITVQELKSRMDQRAENKDDFILVDCREQHEWDQGYIPGAILVPLSCFEKVYENHLKDSAADIVIHCRSGKRSLDACLFLQGEGYEKLTNVTGGILAWADAGYQIATT
jgi:rhodanese-related sulfurtransferase